MKLPLRLIEEARFVIGVDLGQARDFTAIAVVERMPQKPDWFTGKEPPELLHLRHLERMPLGTNYVAQVDHVQMLVGAVWSETVVDQTGVGRGVVDLFRDRGIALHAVTITAGNAEPSYELAKGGQNWKVSKRLLVSTLVALLHSERLKIASALPLAETLTAELLSFDVTTSASGRETFNAREGQHDDLVLAVALACWNATRVRKPPPKGVVRPFNLSR